MKGQNEMTLKEQKERNRKFEEAWKKYDSLAQAALNRAKGAKNNGDKSQYEFWMQEFENTSDRANHFFNEFINSTVFFEA